MEYKYKNVVVDVNDNMKITMGYFKNVKGISTKKLIDDYKKSFPKHDTCVLEECFLHNDEILEMKHTHTKIVRGDFFDTYKVLRIRKNVIRDCHGEVIGVAGIADDITDITLGLEELLKKTKTKKDKESITKIFNIFLDDSNDNIR
jgi:hypothetical protein